MKIGIVTILYHPEAKNLQNLKIYSGLFEKVYVFDNTEGYHQNGNTISALYPEYIYFSSNENIGIAKALNLSAHRAIADGLNGLITMDQDSEWELPVLSRYLDCLKQCEPVDKIAMIGVIFYQVKVSQAYSCIPKPAQRLITSGSYINLDIFVRLNGFDENLFIEFVDTEYCFNAIAHGYELKLFDTIYIRHNIGNSKILKLFSKKYVITLHSPVRMYYLFRNYFYLRKKYSLHRNLNFKPEAIAVYKRIKNNLVFNSQRHKVLFYIFRAIKDIYSNLMGSLQEPTFPKNVT